MNISKPTEKNQQIPDAGLYIVATPIGNLRDITLRALDVLQAADIILCEDTRVSAKLLNAYDMTDKVLWKYHDHNAEKTRPNIIKKIESGAVIAQITDAGTPLISDPGYKLVQECVAAGLYVTALPGPAAAINAMVLSAMPTDCFFFAGFLPQKSGARQNQLQKYMDIPGSLAFYETAPRLIDSLQDMQTVLGDRKAAVARELTKKFEEVRRGRLSELVAWYQENGKPKGEIVIILSELDIAEKQSQFDDETIEEMLKQALSDGMKAKQAANHVADMTGRPKRDLYKIASQLPKS